MCVLSKRSDLAQFCRTKSISTSDRFTADVYRVPTQCIRSSNVSAGVSPLDGRQSSRPANHRWAARGKLPLPHVHADNRPISPGLNFARIVLSMPRCRSASRAARNCICFQFHSITVPLSGSRTRNRPADAAVDSIKSDSKIIVAIALLPRSVSAKKSELS